MVVWPVRKGDVVATCTTNRYCYLDSGWVTVEAWSLHVVARATREGRAVRLSPTRPPGTGSPVGPETRVLTIDPARFDHDAIWDAWIHSTDKYRLDRDGLRDFIRRHGTPERQAVR